MNLSKKSHNHNENKTDNDSIISAT